jgi:integrase
MRTAEIDRLIPRSPCIGIELPSGASHGEMRFLTPEEVGTLADAVPERFRALIYFAAYTGLRWGEIAALRVDNANLLKGKVDVRESMSELNGRIQVGLTKTGKRRTVSLPRFLCDMLGEHIGRFPTNNGYIFSAPRGGPLRRNFYRRQFLPAVKKAGFTPLRFHDLRHTAASIAIANGAHPKEIQERLGHSTIRVTFDRYGHLFPTLDERLRDGLEETYRDAEGNRVGNAWEIGENEPVKLTGREPK